MFKDYDKRIKGVMHAHEDSTDWDGLLKVHRTMIARIQHERLIHLLVTIFVGLIMSISAFITIMMQKTDLLFLCIPLLFLFVAYLLHYRFLENTTQSWYILDDKIQSQIDSQ